ncbi:hypothetical protein [Rheinheimera sp. UJ63]|uniref:hypothetical protein n=1 Tax=Rheinheimera sp. UJ63 TaxID=2910157 RepID=UPI001F27E4E2|nr:hypothetical protein [Rheinheimera sp. UJ63]MCF4008924.1 hypothetical protein [Rheinheimera sp. UJ63]
MKQAFLYSGLIISLLFAWPSQAHKFSTSWVQMSSGADHPAEFDWSWLLAEHDLAVLAPFMMDNTGRLLDADALLAQQVPFNNVINDMLQFNVDCPLEVLPVVHVVREVYAGQQSVRIYGHAGCPLASLQQVRVAQLFDKLKDHKVIVELTDTAERSVLSQSKTQWQLAE